jgi:drug/metabolite transporter (DMT)-like permease
MFCSNYSIKFVNYPFMALAKSAKVLPVVLTGWLLKVYKLTSAQILIAITITAGLIIFNLKKVNGVADESLLGIGLVVLSLLFDGFVGVQ